MERQREERRGKERIGEEMRGVERIGDTQGSNSLLFPDLFQAGCISV